MRTVEVTQVDFECGPECPPSWLWLMVSTYKIVKEQFGLLEGVCLQTAANELALNLNPCEITSCADVLQQVRDFRKRAPLPIWREPLGAIVLARFGIPRFQHGRHSKSDYVGYKGGIQC